MSEKQNINDEIIFQSFSKNLIFESNKEQNKVRENENLEFTFKKNLFQKSEESPTNLKGNQNKFNAVSAFDDQIYDIYSKNDNNIQESGHFGKSKYDSTKYKNIIENSNIPKQSIFSLEEKLSTKYSKKNMSVKNIEKEESKLFDNKSKYFEIRKYKSSVKINLNNSKKNIIKNNISNNRNQKKAIKSESTYYLKTNNLNMTNTNKNNQNHMKEEFNYADKKGENRKVNIPLINRLKKMKENDYFKEIINDTYNRENNSFINTHMIENEIGTFKNNCSIVSINANSKIKKITTGRMSDMRQKLKPNININQKPMSRNKGLCKENKENIPFNYINNNRDSFLNQIHFNNTIMNYSHNRPLYFKDIENNNSINERPYNNPKRMSKAKIKNENKENIVYKYKTTGNYLKLGENKYNPNPNNIMSSSTTNFGYLMKNKIPRTNRNKNNDSLFYNKLSLKNNNQSMAIIKTKTCKNRMNISKENVQGNKILLRSYITRENFGF